MKIVLALGWYYPESTGGTEAYVAALARRFAAAGHDVWIAAPTTTSQEHAYIHDAIPVYRYPITVPLSRTARQGFSVAGGAERFHAWLAKRRPDVLHVHSIVPGLGVWELQAARAAGACTLATVHQPALGYLCQRGTMMFWGERLCDGLCRPAKCTDCFLRGRGMRPLFARALGGVPPSFGRAARYVPGRAGTALGMTHYIRRRLRLQEELLSRVDRFVLLTRWALEAVAANGAPRDKLALNRLGVEQVRHILKAGPAESPTRVPVRIGYLGRFEALKGTEILARAVASLPHALPLRIEFCGPVNGAADQETVRRLRDILTGDPRVTFAPAVAPEDVAEILAGYDILCCPSVCVEGGPTVALEALAGGTPVLGTRIGGLAEILDGGGGGFLVPPGDERALAEVLRRIAADPAGTVDHWRRHLPPVRTMDEVTGDYLALYAE